MPTITLTAPDGKTITLTPPDGATPEEIQGVVNDVIANYQPSGAGVSAPTPDAGISREERLKILSQPPPSPGSSSPGFFQTLGSEVGGGLRQMVPSGEGGPSNPLAPFQPALGAARVAFAPVTALGARFGKTALDYTGSPAAAEVADMIGQMGGSALEGKLAGAMARLPARLAPHLPGAGGALREQATQEVRGLVAPLTPTTPSKDLYAAVEMMNPDVSRLPKLEAAASELAAKEDMLAGARLSNSELSRVSKGILASLQKGEMRGVTGTVELGPETTAAATGMGKGSPIFDATIQEAPVRSFKEVRGWLERIGQKIHDLRTAVPGATKRTETLEGMQKLWGSVLSDLENSTEKQVKPVAEMLKLANHAKRREFAQEELSDIIEKGIKFAEGSPLPERATFSKMLQGLQDELKKNPNFEKAFTKQELDHVREVMDAARTLPLPAAPRTQAVGSSLNWKRASAGGFAGSIIGGAVGGVKGAMIGGTVGTFAGNTIGEAISSALMTQGGRNFLVAIIRHQPSMLFSAKGATLISAAARAAREQEGR